MLLDVEEETSGVLTGVLTGVVWFENIDDYV